MTREEYYQWFMKYEGEKLEKFIEIDLIKEKLIEDLKTGIKKLEKELNNSNLILLEKLGKALLKLQELQILLEESKI